MKNMKNNINEKAQVMIIFVFAVIALLGFSALAIDGANVYRQRRQDQATADSAVLAGAQAAAQYLKDHSGSTCASVSASGSDGFKKITNAMELPSGSSSTITCDTSGMTINAIVPSDVKTYFLQAIPGSKQSLTSTKVEATAKVNIGSSGSMFGGAALVSLSSSGCGMTFTSTIVKIVGGGIFVNSSEKLNTSSGDAALCSNWNPTIDTSSCIGVVGDLDINFTGPYKKQTITGSGFCSAKPTQIEKPDYTKLIPAIPTPTPTCSTDGTWNASTRKATAGNFTDLTIPYNGGTLDSGIYCISGTFNKTGGATVTGGDVVMVFTGSAPNVFIGSGAAQFDSLQIYINDGIWEIAGSSTLTVPGVFRYYSKGTSNFKVGGSSTITLKDGLFYLTNSKLDMEGSTILNLTAPTSGDFKGIAIYEPTGNKNSLIVCGGSNDTITGSIIAPDAEIHLNGSANANGINSQIVGDKIVTEGNSQITINYDPNLNFSGTSSSTTIDLLK